MNQMSCNTCGSNHINLLRETMGMLFCQCQSCGKSLSYQSHLINNTEEEKNNIADIAGAAASTVAVVEFFDSDMGEKLVDVAKDSLDNLQDDIEEISENIIENIIDFVQDSFD